jgi:CRISPR system Cascade subunit CasC
MSNVTIQNPKFLQLHFLTSYPAVLLNRDDAGFAKRIPFGGATRTRISSQCLKRHWRTAETEFALSKLGLLSVRSRYTFNEEISKPLIAAGKKPEIVQAVTEALATVVLGQSAKAEKAKDKEATETGDLKTGQITVLGRPEIEYLLKQAEAICSSVSDAKSAKKAVDEHFKNKEIKTNFEAMKKANAGLDAALFGRMVTSDYLARGDAAVHVAHAFTVHAEASESDYFSAVDDLQKQATDEQLGSGHIGNVELNSGLYYGYVVVDIPLLVSNLEGCKRDEWLKADRTLASKVVKNLVNLIATVSPGAKLGSTAPYAYAHMVLAEAGNAQPATFANAFIKPTSDKNDLLVNSYVAVSDFIKDLDGMYGARNERAFSAMKDSSQIKEAVGCEKIPLPDLADWAMGKVKGGA